MRSFTSGWMFMTWGSPASGSEGSAPSGTGSEVNDTSSGSTTQPPTSGSSGTTRAAVTPARVGCAIPGASASAAAKDCAAAARCDSTVSPCGSVREAIAAASARVGSSAPGSMPSARGSSTAPRPPPRTAACRRWLCRCAGFRSQVAALTVLGRERGKRM
jgi:hypothetical protein